MLYLFFILLSVVFAKDIYNKKIFAFIDTVLIILYLLLLSLFYVANYFTGEGINDAFIFTLVYGLKGAGFNDYKGLIITAVISLIATIIIGFLYFKLLQNKNKITNKRKFILHVILFICAVVIHPFTINMYDRYRANVISKSVVNDFNKYYKKIDFTKKIKNNYNLVFIYGESLERTYFDEQIFPDLMPNLNRIVNESYDFTNVVQAWGTGWTIGGFVASQCGIPLYFHSNGNSMSGGETFLKNAQCLGDFLKQNNYYLEYIQGASIVFSGKDKFYKTHKFDKVYGRDELKRYLINKNYLNAWGLYDDTLLDIAFEKYNKLSKQKKHFALFLETLDTHHPKGHMSKSCKDMGYKNGDNEILNAVHCSDYLIYKFIKKIRNSKYKDNTIIVLASDHLALRNTVSNLLNKADRKNLFLIITPENDKHISINKKASTLDITSTILHLFGIDTDLGLGRDLFEKESLFAKIKDFNIMLRAWKKQLLSFWDFPKLNDSIIINLDNKFVDVSNIKYKLPVLFMVDDNLSLEPIFEFDSPIKLESYIDAFKKGQKFIWIDYCKKVNKFFEKNHQKTFCVVQGEIDNFLNITELTGVKIKVKVLLSDK